MWNHSLGRRCFLSVYYLKTLFHCCSGPVKGCVLAKSTILGIFNISFQQEHFTLEHCLVLERCGTERGGFEIRFYGCRSHEFLAYSGYIWCLEAQNPSDWNVRCPTWGVQPLCELWQAEPDLCMEGSKKVIDEKSSDVFLFHIRAHLTWNYSDKSLDLPQLCCYLQPYFNVRFIGT